MSDKRNFVGRIKYFITVFSIIITALVMLFTITHYREMGKILQVSLLLKTQYLEETSTGQILEGAVKGMVDSLQDPYSVYMDKKQYANLQEHIQGSIGGIGIYVGEKEKKLVVVAPIDGTPAAKAGIQRGDVIIKIDDKFTSEIEVDEAVAIMRGDPGTKVHVVIMREGAAKLLEFELVREIINIPTLESRTLQDNPEIGHMVLTMFASNSDEAFAKQLTELKQKGIKALILDLRNNPGGDLDTALKIARYLVPAGPVVYTVDKAGSMYALNNEVVDNINMPLAVLINEGSASAAEVLSGAIKDTKSGTLVGEKTYGKALIQTLYPIVGGDGLKLTTAKYLTPNKIDIQKKGIEPDIKVENEGEEDLQLKKAVEILLQQLE